MPWNSSKSDISTKHEVFLALRTWLVQVVKDYSSLSRIWMQIGLIRFLSTPPEPSKKCMLPTSPR